jgi:pyruvate dehydrogenase E2 component (dihydrolipoamide acetyltransferase)
MAEKILMLALSPTMMEGSIAVWKFKEGAEIKKGSVLCEVETDKAVMDYESSVAGTLLKIVKTEGEKAAVGDLIAVVGKPNEDIASLLAGLAGVAAPAVKLPSAGVPASLETAPAPVVVSTPSAAPGALPSVASGTLPSLPPGTPPSSPLARVLARNAGIDLRSIPGSGPIGRVVKRDVEAILHGSASRKPQIEVQGATEQGTALSRGMPNKSKAEQKREKLADRSVPVGRIRAVVAKRLTDSLRDAPHFFLRSAVEADRLIALRSALNEGRDEGSKISLNTLFAKLSAAAIVRNPDINSSWKGETIEYRKSVDVALAVALPEGLIAPVVRDCANKGLDEMEQEFRALIAKAKAGGLKPEDYEGATFTISNLGAWGVEEFTAIINPPGSAILALGAIAKEPVVRPSSSGNDEIVIRSILRATLSCDHRVIDGAVGAAFLRDLKAFFEEPSRALL